MVYLKVPEPNRQDVINNLNARFERLASNTPKMFAMPRENFTPTQVSRVERIVSPVRTPKRHIKAGAVSTSQEGSTTSSSLKYFSALVSLKPSLKSQDIPVNDLIKKIRNVLLSGDIPEPEEFKNIQDRKVRCIFLFYIDLWDLYPSPVKKRNYTSCEDSYPLYKNPYRKGSSDLWKEIGGVG
jgi:hypothetical protein